MPKFTEISIVIPCYREAEVIEANIQAVHDHIRSRFERFEIIVITDGSPDGTPEHVEHLKKALPEIPLIHIAFPKNRGKGAAVRAGMLAAKYGPILFLDADLTIPITETEAFAQALENADLAIASRLLPGSRFEEPAPWYRVLMARSFHILQMILLGNFEFSDTQCGFKMFRRSAARDLFSRAKINRFAFDAEIIFLASKKNYRIATLPVTIMKDPRNTNVNLVSDPVNMFLALLKIRFLDIIGTYRKIPLL